MQFSLRNNKSILNWLIYAAYAGLFFPIRISNISLIALLVFCAISITPKEVVKSVKSSPVAILLVAIFFLQIIGLLYTSNIKTGFFVLEKKIAFLLIPVLVLPAIHKMNLNIPLLLKRIGLITLSSSVVLLAIAVYRKFVLNNPLAFSFVSGNEFKGFTSIHYVYYAMYFTFGVLILLNYVFDDLKKTRSGLLVLSLLLLYSLGIIIQVASKTGIMIFILALILFFYFKLANKKIFAVSIVFLLLSASVFLYYNDTTRTRFMGLSEDLVVLKQDSLQTEVEFTGLNMRLLFWKLSVTHLAQDGLVLTGVGTGDTQNYIDSLYNLPQYKLYGYLNWDSHNQWVYALIQLGVIGVSFLGALYVVSFREALLRNDPGLLFFLLITLAFSLSESIFELNKGIVFGSLFFTLLTASYTRNNYQSHSRQVNA